MIIFDYEAIRTQAMAARVSPYTLVKQELNYRKKETDNSCGNCITKELCAGSVAGMKCRTIGISSDHHADIDTDHICDSWHIFTGRYK